jgi:hypothetical protein
MLEIYKRVFWPDKATEFFPDNHIPRMFEECGQQQERLGLQPYSHSMLAKHALGNIDLKRSESKDLPPRTRRLHGSDLGSIQRKNADDIGGFAASLIAIPAA